MKHTITLLAALFLASGCGVIAERPPVPKGDAEPINSLATSKMLMHDAGYVAIGSGWQRIGNDASEEPETLETFFQGGVEFALKPEDEQRLFNRLPEKGSFGTLPGRVVVPRTVSVPFSWNSTAFKPTESQMLHMRQLFAVADRIEVRGRTDGVGDQSGDEMIARERAQAAKRYLIDRGVPAGIISVNYVSGGDYVANNALLSGRRQNRRVDIEFIITDFTAS